MILAWRRRPKTGVWARVTPASGTENGWTPSWTRWLTCCRSSTTSCPSWTGCPYYGCPSATCAPRAISKVSQFNYYNIDDVQYSTSPSHTHTRKPNYPSHGFLYNNIKQCLRYVVTSTNSTYFNLECVRAPIKFQHHKIVV